MKVIQFSVYLVKLGVLLAECESWVSKISIKRKIGRSLSHNSSIPIYRKYFKKDAIDVKFNKHSDDFFVNLSNMIPCRNNHEKERHVFNTLVDQSFSNERRWKMSRTITIHSKINYKLFINSHELLWSFQYLVSSKSTLIQYKPIIVDFYNDNYMKNVFFQLLGFTNKLNWKNVCVWFARRA